MKKLIPIFDESRLDISNLLLMTPLAREFKVKTVGGDYTLKTAPLSSSIDINVVRQSTSEVLVNNNYINENTKLNPHIRLSKLYLTFGEKEYDTSKILCFDVSKLEDVQLKSTAKPHIVELETTLPLAVRVGSVNTAGDAIFEEKDNIPGLNDSDILFSLDVEVSIQANLETGRVSPLFTITDEPNDFRHALEKNFGGKLYVQGYEIEAFAS